MPALKLETEVSRTDHLVSPALVFETLNRYQHSLALKGAIELDLFTHIADGAVTVQAIAQQCKASERGIRILCDFLTIMGFLLKDDGRYELTPTSAMFLNKKSPAYLGSVSRVLASPGNIERLHDVAELVRRGGALADSDILSPENERWVDFARSMAPAATLASRIAAPMVSEPGKRMKILDVAAGAGMFGISVARNNPAAEIVALDWPNVLKIARENAAKAGVQDRYHTIAGDVFDAAVSDGYDLVLISNFLHMFDAAANIGLLRKLHAALKVGGRVATIEFVPNEDRITPPIPAAFSLTMLANTPCGDAYTFRELDQMFRDAGFGKSSQHSIAPTPLTLVITSA
jgi:ubiquinone/menaquinone biosynthesis C-methylase UbiE